jgi:hypothetical protein
MVTYKEVKDMSGSVVSITRSDGACIPFALENTDYQAYLAWLEAGNQPLPPDEA